MSADTRKIAGATPWLLIVICVALVAALAALAVVIHNLSNLTQANRAAALATCQRGNNSRQVQVHNFRRDITFLHSDAAFGKAVLEIPHIEGTDLGNRVHDFIDAHHEAIQGKRHTIAGLIAANAPVAVKPGSVVADCSKAVGSS